MKLIDMHSHWGTERGYVLRTAAELAQQKKTWNSETKYVTEDEMVTYFRASHAHQFRFERVFLRASVTITG
jgi:hypothetical protein